jgi:hypothetical protein
MNSADGRMELLLDSVATSARQMSVVFAKESDGTSSSV